MNIANTLQILSSVIEKMRTISPLGAGNVTLLAASKTQSVTVIREAIVAGVVCFGENRVQEAREKWVDIKKEYPNVQLHFIGHLQTNKVKQALALFDVIQTLDRVALAEALSAELKRNSLESRALSVKKKDGKESNISNSQFITQRFYIQVNTGKELQKAGVLPENVDEFIAFCRELELPVTGLMCVPPVNQPPAPHFALLREIALRNNLFELSMGMSDDFETAVRMGSSCVRIGTTLFGTRALF